MKPKAKTKPQEEDTEPLLRPATPEESTAELAGGDDEIEEELDTAHGGDVADEDEESGSEEEPEPDKSTWPLLYQIIDVDPATEESDFKQACDLSLKRLARRNNPKFLPNDADAPQRWAAVTKAHETLTDPERRRFYDMRNTTPAALVDFDLSSLRIE